MKKYFIPFSNCIPVKGYTRSMLYDLQRNELLPIPNELADILQLKHSNNLSNIYNTLSEVSTSLILDDYFDFLESNELIFYSEDENEIDFFPSLNFEWDYPGLFIDIIIELTDNNQNEIKQFLIYFEKNGGRFVEIRYFGQGFQIINNFLRSLCNSAIRSIGLYILNDVFEESQLNEFYSSNNRISKIIVYSERQKKHQSKIFKYVNEINWGENNLVEKDSMIINMNYFMESHFFNPFFNKKLFINKNCEIKNTPKSNKILGEISRDNVDYTILKDFDTIKDVTKDKVDICKNCEFRYSCFDHRIPENREQNEWFHKIECNYNPYICKWRDEEGYQTLEECGVISNEKGFSIDHKKIAKINAILWSEEVMEN